VDVGVVVCMDVVVCWVCVCVVCVFVCVWLCVLVSVLVVFGCVFRVCMCVGVNACKTVFGCMGLCVSVCEWNFVVGVDVSVSVFKCVWVCVRCVCARVCCEFWGVCVGGVWLCV
jgi:hypothetical protein